MKYNFLGMTNISVSNICLGTMTWGEQNTAENGFEQMDYAIDHGINFFDTAEMYPVATRKETYGRTEEIIGDWLQMRGHRSKLVIATKVCGPGRHHVRNGISDFNKQTIKAAVEGSLKRLKTDYIDLYQLHWPDRGWADFQNLGQTSPVSAKGANREDTISALDELIQAGQIRSWGVSNESAWGVMDFVSRSKPIGTYLKPSSIQNAYNLLNRKYEIALSEISFREKISLLAYAPIAAGALTGKYLHGSRPAGSRAALWPENDRYFNPQAENATQEYISLAAEWNVAPEILAHAFVLSRPFLTSSIVGATSLSHLEKAITALDFNIPDELSKQLELLHRKYLIPAP